MPEMLCNRERPCRVLCLDCTDDLCTHHPDNDPGLRALRVRTGCGRARKAAVGEEEWAAGYMRRFYAAMGLDPADAPTKLTDVPAWKPDSSVLTVEYSKDHLPAVAVKALGDLPRGTLVQVAVGPDGELEARAVGHVEVVAEPGQAPAPGLGIPDEEPTPTDIHTETAARVFGGTPHRTLRDLMKTMGYAAAYGAKVWSPPPPPTDKVTVTTYTYDGVRFVQLETPNDGGMTLAVARMHGKDDLDPDVIVNAGALRSPKDKTTAKGALVAQSRLPAGELVPMPVSIPEALRILGRELRAAKTQSFPLRPKWLTDARLARFSKAVAKSHKEVEEKEVAAPTPTPTPEV